MSRLLGPDFTVHFSYVRSQHYRLISFYAILRHHFQRLLSFEVRLECAFQARSVFVARRANETRAVRFLPSRGEQPFSRILPLCPCSVKLRRGLAVLNQHRFACARHCIRGDFSIREAAFVRWPQPWWESNPA